MNETETEVEIAETSPAGKKQVFLKQYLVSGSKNIYDADSPKKAAFIMHTCAKSARDEFKSRFGMDVASCAQTAESSMTKEDMDGRDFWKERINWETECRKPELTPSAKKYFWMKDKAEFVQAEKRRLGISKWDSATAEQVDAISKTVSEWEKTHPL